MTATAAPQQRHTVTALVQNEAGTINRLVSLFRRRGFSLVCFNAGDCEQPGFSRITLVVNGDDAQLYQCLKQLDKLIDVVEVEDLKPEQSVSRELTMVKVASTKTASSELEAVATAHGATIPKRSAQEAVVEYVGEAEDVEKLIESLKPFQITEIVRTGTVAIKLEN